MTTTRRSFLQSTIAAGAAGAAATFGSAAAAASMTRTQDESDMPEKKLNLLILGGTGFLGPHIVNTALARGHTMTLFNRGRTNDDLFPQLETIHGDRDPNVGDGLTGLEGRSFDAVIDTSGYVPRIVRASAELLVDSVKQYVFISSISVYDDTSALGIDETDPVGSLQDTSVEQITGQTYGPLKALCERAAGEVFSGRATNIRPGLIVGPLDYSDRFTYWPVRVQQGGNILAPGNPDDPVQYIDARDLAAFIIRCIEDNTAGVFNATGPNTPTTIAELLYGCKAVTGGDVTFTWVDAEFLGENGVSGWSDMPVWMNPTNNYAGFHRIDISRAVAAGLQSRPLAQIVRDTLEWFNNQPEERRALLAPETNGPPRRAGISREREQEVLKAWLEQDNA